MTSNTGAKDINKKSNLGFADGFKGEKKKYEYKKYLKDVFNPEFLNRVDSIVNFSELDDQSLILICKKLISELKNRLNSIGIELDVSDDVYEYIIKDDIDKEYGARPLRRYIIDRIEIPITNLLIEEKLKKGGKVTIGTANGAFDILISSDANKDKAIEVK